MNKNGAWLRKNFLKIKRRYPMNKNKIYPEKSLLKKFFLILTNISFTDRT